MNYSNNQMNNDSGFDMDYGTNKIISASKFNLIIGGCLLWGFVCNAIIITFFSQWVLSLNYWLVLIGYLISCFAGVMIYSKSDKPFISFIGYNLIVLPIGILLTSFLYGTNATIVLQAVVTTGAVTLIMMIASTIYPSFFMKIGNTLFIALLSVIVVEVILVFFFSANPSIMDWGVALIFCGYIGYDWAIANQKEKTADNAVDGAAALYMDIINLFIRIVSILSRKD